VAQNLLKRKGGGRIAAIEVLVVNAAVSMLIREAKSSQIMSIMQTGKKEGMTLLNQELTRLVREDLVEPEEAYSKAVDRDDLLKQFEAARIPFKPVVDQPAESAPA
jgi:twitching motility protein PilT